jgi:hypothetical protein
MQMQQMQAQQTGQPPQIPPEMQMLMSAPSWEDISAKLRDQYERTYRIDVETNSTVDLEATEDKAQIAEFMNAWGQMMSGITPLVESGAMPFEAAKVVMGEVFRRFRFARRVEQALDLIQQPQPKEDPKVVEEKHKLELTKVQSEAKRQIGEMQESMIEATGEIERLRIQLEELKAGQSIMSASHELDTKGMEVQGRMTEHSMKTDYQGKLRQNEQQFGQKLQQKDAEIQNMGMQHSQQVQDLQGKMAEQTMGTQMQEHQNQMNQMLQQMQQIHQEITASEEEDGSEEEKSAVLEELVKSQQMLMQAVAQLAQVVGADRETEVVMGPDGKKRGRSRVVVQ